ncbi:MAG: hypothetical protein JXM73_11270 [Anaerolineae bacterium]|nr:hypothetical protein [Anaerolineae bacterium]
MDPDRSPDTPDCRPEGPWAVQRPGLEYQHAFDLCAMGLHRAQGPVAVVASRPFYARELLKRTTDLDRQLILASESDLSNAAIEEGLGPEVDRTHLRIERGLDPHTGLDPDMGAAVWAEPIRANARVTLQAIRQALIPGGPLYILVSGWLARFLPEWKAGETRTGGIPLGWDSLRRARQAGFAIEKQYGFHPPTSVAWGYMSRMMDRLGRGDLADRCLFKMRACYVVAGWRASWTPLRLIVTRKESA